MYWGYQHVKKYRLSVQYLIIPWYISTIGCYRARKLEYITVTGWAAVTRNDNVILNAIYVRRRPGGNGKLKERNRAFLWHGVRVAAVLLPFARAPTTYTAATTVRPDVDFARIPPKAPPSTIATTFSRGRTPVHKW